MSKCSYIGCILPDLVEYTSDRVLQALLLVAARHQLQLPLAEVCNEALHLAVPRLNGLLLGPDQARRWCDIVDADGEAPVANEAGTELGQAVHAGCCCLWREVGVQHLRQASKSYCDCLSSGRASGKFQAHPKQELPRMLRIGYFLADFELVRLSPETWMPAVE